MVSSHNVHRCFYVGAELKVELVACTLKYMPSLIPRDCSEFHTLAGFLKPSLRRPFLLREGEPAYQVS